jgi:hypothetical protein
MERSELALIGGASNIRGTQAMQVRILAYLLALSPSLVLGADAARATDWEPYAIAKSGAGRRFYTNDRRADLTVRAIPNLEDDTPAAFLAKRRPPSGIVYKRVTSGFFVVSSFRDEMIWYNRCNRSPGYMNCVLINYPASEKRQWDAIVTRISHSLAP